MFYLFFWGGGCTRHVFDVDVCCAEDVDEGFAEGGGGYAGLGLVGACCCVCFGHVFLWGLVVC